MTDVAFPTMEDLLRIDEVEYVKLEDFDFTSLCEELLTSVEKPPDPFQGVPNLEIHQQQQMELLSQEDIDFISFCEDIFTAGEIQSVQGVTKIEIHQQQEVELLRLEDFDFTPFCEDIIADGGLPPEPVQGVPNFEILQHQEVEILTPQQKRFTCDVCGKRFSNHQRKVNHSLVHSIASPYCCELCHRGFRFNSSLKEHFRAHCKRSL